MELSELVACTLSHPDLKSQRERWLNLARTSASAAETQDGLRLSFRNHPRSARS